VHNSNLVPDTDYSDCAFLWVSSDHPCRFRSSTYCFLPRPSRLIRPACHRISYSTLCSPSYRTVMLHGLHKYRNPHRPLQSNTQHFCFLLTEVPRSHLGLETGERILREVSPPSLIISWCRKLLFQIKPRRIPLRSSPLLSDRTTILCHYRTTNSITK